ncbi:MAG: YcxB family protein [Polyangiaceae bacterium]|nr:YcxB family protein [Polyangiaceae bacterium]
MIAPVTLRFRYTEADYRRAVRAHFERRLHLRLDAAVALAGLGGALALVGLEVEPVWVWGALAAVSVVLLALVVSALTWVPGTWWRAQPKLRAEYLVTFAEDGIAFRAGSIDSRLGWDHYDRLVSDGAQHFLYYGSAFTVVPRSAFPCAADEERFLALAQSHVAPRSA